MGKLELKHLAPYLPYGLQVTSDRGRVLTMGLHIDSDKDYVSIDWVFRNTKYYKPILRPLSDFGCEVTFVSKLFKSDEYISTSTKDKQSNHKIISAGECDLLAQWKFERLLQMHFDVFGLIEKSLAIDTNNLN